MGSQRTLNNRILAALRGPARKIAGTLGGTRVAAQALLLLTGLGIAHGLLPNRITLVFAVPLVAAAVLTLWRHTAGSTKRLALLFTVLAALAALWAPEGTLSAAGTRSAEVVSLLFATQVLADSVTYGGYDRIVRNLLGRLRWPPRWTALFGGYIFTWGFLMTSIPVLYGAIAGLNQVPPSGGAAGGDRPTQPKEPPRGGLTGVDLSILLSRAFASATMVTPLQSTVLLAIATSGAEMTSYVLSSLPLSIILLLAGALDAPRSKGPSPAGGGDGEPLPRAPGGPADGAAKAAAAAAPSNDTVETRTLPGTAADDTDGGPEGGGKKGAAPSTGARSTGGAGSALVREKPAPEDPTELEPPVARSARGYILLSLFFASLVLSVLIVSRLPVQVMAGQALAISTVAVVWGRLGRRAMAPVGGRTPPRNLRALGRDYVGRLSDGILLVSMGSMAGITLAATPLMEYAAYGLRGVQNELLAGTMVMVVIIIMRLAGVAPAVILVTVGPVLAAGLTMAPVSMALIMAVGSSMASILSPFSMSTALAVSLTGDSALYISIRRQTAYALLGMALTLAYSYFF